MLQPELRKRFRAGWSETPEPRHAMAPRYLIPLLFLLALVLASLLLRPATPVPGPAAESAPVVPAGGGPGSVAHAIAEREAGLLLQDGRPWRAALLLRQHLDRHPDAPPGTVLLAARAEAGWGGWDRVRALLDGPSRLAEAGEDEALYLLARAWEEDGDLARAADAYRDYLSHRGDATAIHAAELRAAPLLIRAGRKDDVRALLGRLRQASPALARWVDLLVAEALASRGDTVEVRRMASELEGAPFGRRARRAQVAAHRAAGDLPGALRLAGAFSRAAGSDAERAEFALAAALAARDLNDPQGARGHLRVAVAAAPASTAALEAARLLDALGGLAPADQLAVARVFDRHGQGRRAAEAYGAWLAHGAGSAAERRDVQLSRGRALFDAGALAEAEAALRPLHDTPGALAAEALYLSGRVQYRTGRHTAARDTYLQVASRFPRTQTGAEALYLVADLHHGNGESARARPLYRRVADEFPESDRAGLALMRLAGMAYLDDDFGAAERIWNEYRTRYPRGQLWLQAAYWAGRALEARGERVAARARYQQVRDRDPLSYYALRATERLGLQFWPVPMDASPEGHPAARARVEAWMRSLDLLREAGLFDEAEAEAARLAQQAGTAPGLLYPLAEALNERGYTSRGIRLGLQLQGRATRLNPRLLRILYPLPYRRVIEAEAREVGLDPLLAAALIRQESMFNAGVTSPAGARGLMQIMPETGRAVAASLGIARWGDELLFQPEINVHLGTRYLAEQMRAYRGSLPSVFSAYNAGPHRIEDWRAFPEYADEELFTERIPFRETRDYVKILMRNLAIYQGLYRDAE